MRHHKVAIQGTLSSYHDLAARRFYGADTETIECSTFREVCTRLVNNEADYAVMAIENSTAGSILSNYALIEEYKLTIIGELYERIQFHLMANPGVTLDQLQYVHSHPMAIAQCQDFLLQHAHLKAVELGDTAGCAKNIRDNNWDTIAAIANEETAHSYGLNILERNIETNKQNYTRFLVLSKGKLPVENPDKASLSFQVEHKTNALAKTLQVLSNHDINLSKIQSVPLPATVNQYSFHIDVEGLLTIITQQP